VIKAFGQHFRLIVGAVAAVFVAHAISYLAIRLLPDSAERIAGMLGGSEAVVVHLRGQMPQGDYFDRLVAMMKGDLGKSVDGVPVVRQIIEALALSIPRFLIAAALLVVIATAVLRRPAHYGVVDAGLEWAVQVPPFVWCFFGFIVVITTSDGVDKSALSISNLATVVATATAPAALLVLQARNVMRQQALSDFAIYMQSLGMPASNRAGVLRSAAIHQLLPTIEKLVMWLALSLLFSEMLLSLPGIGQLMLAALSRSDVNSLLGIILLLATLSNLTRLIVAFVQLRDLKGALSR
jgi:ABC-type dipeptide/oligopeptide/nickel transport system permease component